MDFSKYSNINNFINRFGGVKQTIVNKKVYQEGMESWERLSEGRIRQIDSEIPNGVELNFKMKTYRTLLTPSAILVCFFRTCLVIPVEEILWIYNRIAVQKMNFIPYNKIHILVVHTKDGEMHYIGESHTGGFSKKMPNDSEMEKIKNTFDSVRKGIVYGADNEMWNLCTHDLQAAIERVEENSK